MKKQGDKTSMSGLQLFRYPTSESHNNQEKVGSENETDNFHLLGSNDHNDMGEVIRRWESLRYMI